MEFFKPGTHECLELFHCCFVAKSCLTLATPWTVARQAPLSMGFFQARILGNEIIPAYSRRTMTLSILLLPSAVSMSASDPKQSPFSIIFHRTTWVDSCTVSIKQFLGRKIAFISSEDKEEKNRKRKKIGVQEQYSRIPGSDKRVFEVSKWGQSVFLGVFLITTLSNSKVRSPNRMC